MVLGEEYMRGILRPPPADPSALPPNPPHPFQKSFAFYLRQRFVKYHWPLVMGYGVAIWAFMGVDEARRNAAKAAYDKAIAEGHAPCEWRRAAHRPGSSRRSSSAGGPLRQRRRRSQREQQAGAGRPQRRMRALRPADDAVCCCLLSGCLQSATTTEQQQQARWTLCRAAQQATKQQQQQQQQAVSQLLASQLQRGPFSVLGAAEAELC